MKTSLWTRAGIVAAALIFCVSLANAQGVDLLVTNVQAQQRPGTYLVDVTYDLETVGDIAVKVSVSLSADSGVTYPFACQSATGHVGASVLPGTNRQIVWDAGTDFPGFTSTTCRLRVTADDGQTNIPAGFVAIAPGTFIMGSPTDEPGRSSSETQHQVTLTHGIYVQTTEVTNQQYMEMAQWAYDRGYATATSSLLNDNLDGSTQILKFLGHGTYDISFSNGVFSCINPSHPVNSVTWYGSVAYCDWLSLQQGLLRAYSHATWQCNGGNPYTAAGYRLPTEAEWEYACRAGSVTAFANGPITYPLGCTPIDPNLDEMGWYCGNNGRWPRPGAQKLPNAWGLYDLHGNVLEWCHDWYGAYGGTVTNPVGPAWGPLPWGSSYRVLRGGDFSHVALYCRSASRGRSQPDHSSNSDGFRPVRSAN
jgi:formylglycine-generating enzyme required for sulfatase activity